MGRASTIERHPRRDEIVMAMTAGQTLSEISDRFGLSVQALSRFRISRNVLVAPTDVPSVSDVITRVVELADDARRLRQITSQAAPGIRSRLIDSEARILVQLSERLGIEDTTVVDVLDASRELVTVVGRWTLTNPELGHSLVTALKSAPHQNIAEFGNYLAQRIAETEI